MRYLLDTNICIYLIKKKPAKALAKFQAHSVGDIGISAVTVAELQYGVHKSQHVEQNQRALEQFLIPLICIPFDDQAAAAYGEIRAALETQGTPIGALDTLIAAHALSLNVTLVTNNTREFSRVPGLQVVDWANE
jgi:tRNA(fMet)-specific endonuclease VapC